MSLNDFVILQKLGSGSFATVYKARRLIDQQIYALKKIDLKALGSKEKNNALNEIRLLACLSSPYIIGYCESFFDEKLDLLTIAMQYANEGDLLKKVQKQKKLRSLMPEVEVWKIFIHLLYGLNKLHSKNILHRDLKAENIFIGNGVYKIGDMNVSKIIKNGLASTQTGTPYYASPQVWNDQPYNDKSDIWSLGCILYEVVTLRPPYEASSMQKLFDMVTRAPTPKIPNNYSRQLQLIIDSCLQKNPCNRPSTKDLFSNQTLKIYENLLIEFKPDIGNDIKQTLLKTIYMPSSKRELKNQLPQSNYKSSQTKNVTKQEEQKQVQSAQKEVQKKPQLTNIDNLIRQNDSEKKNQCNRNRNRIKSSHIFKESPCKKNSSKQKLMARADFIIESQRKSNKQKENSHVSHSAKVPKMYEKKSSQKEIDMNLKQLSQKCLNRQIYIEDEEIVVPKRLIFDETVTEQKQLTQKLIQIHEGQKNQKSTETQLKETIICKEVQKMSEPLIQLKDEDNLTRQAYLIDTLKNISAISQQNHQHYKFETDTQPIIKSQQDQNSPQQDPLSNFLAQTFPQSLQAELKSIHIRIDVNQNQQVIKAPTQTTPENKMSFIFGLYKIQNLTQNITFKNKHFAFSSLKNQLIRLRTISKQSQLQLKIYQDSHKLIQLTLQNFSKQTSENTPLKTFQKRSRSKSIRKTQKFNRIPSESNTNSSATLIDKINEKINIELSQKKNSKQKSAKKQKPNKKIFDKQNLPSEKLYENNYHQKLKQMILVPRVIQPSSSKALSREKRKPQQHTVRTSQKAKHQVLRELQPNNIMAPHKSQKKVQYQGIYLFEQKKKKIFQTSNPVHDANDRLDRINLDKKMKKYINV